MVKFLAHLFCLIIYPFSFLVPRKESQWAFGSYRGAFNDNSKYLFIHTFENHPEVKSCWISNSKKTVRLVQSLGLNSLYLFSFRGIWFALRSGKWFVNAYSSDIMFCLSGGATIVNLWHGVGLKRCEFNIENGPLAKRYVKKTLYERITHPESFRRPDYLLTVSDFQTKMFSRAFRVGEDRCIKLGYPRNQILVMDEPDRETFIERYEPCSTKHLIGRLKNYQTVYIYMPTWRESQRDIFTQQFDFVRLNRLMMEQNAAFILKPHANTLVDEKCIGQFSNIILLEGGMDIYPILAYCDVLVTDYSSILYDFINRPNISVLLFLYDYEEYKGTRDFYYPFEENVVGTKVVTFDELIEAIEKGNSNGMARLDILRNKFWGDSVTSSASEDIVRKFLLKEEHQLCTSDFQSN